MCHQLILCFLQVYREIIEKILGRSGHKKPYPQDDPSGRNLARRNSPDQLSYKSLANGHSSSDQGVFKPNGLIKKVCQSIEPTFALL